jgi:hypothetical protein
VRLRLAGASLWLALALPWSRELLERVMVTHMVVQIPLLALAGGLLAADLPPRWRERIAEWNQLGIAGTLLALIASSWWMVPRALDEALASPAMEIAKFVSLPLLVGAPLALSWRALGFIGRGFVLVNVLPMWAVVGWMYVVSPARLCNYYLVDQQVAAGTGLLLLAGLIGLTFCMLSFRSSPAVDSSARQSS